MGRHRRHRSPTWGRSAKGYEVVEVADDRTVVVVVVELGAVPAEPAVVAVVVLGEVVDGGTVVVVELAALVVVVVELVVVVDFAGGVVVVVVVSWATGFVLEEASGGYWMYRAPNPRKAVAISAVDRRTRSRRWTGRLMKPRSPLRFGRSGRDTFARFDHRGRTRRLASNGFVLSSSVMAPSSSHRPWAAS